MSLSGWTEPNSRHPGDILSKGNGAATNLSWPVNECCGYVGGTSSGNQPVASCRSMTIIIVMLSHPMPAAAFAFSAKQRSITCASATQVSRLAPI
jgi:hypothetical protein